MISDAVLSNGRSDEQVSVTLNRSPSMPSIKNNLYAKFHVEIYCLSTLKADYSTVPL